MKKILTILKRVVQFVVFGIIFLFEGANLLFQLVAILILEKMEGKNVKIQN